LRPGPAAYDVASLLYDPYVALDGTDRKLLLELLAKDASAPSPRLVTLAAVQRLCQALGAYCRLAAAGQPRFTAYILRALGNLHHAVHEAELPALAAFSHALIEREKLRHERAGCML
jgi:aminoglycoside/choline kinase family phosphotransferase